MQLMLSHLSVGNPMKNLIGEETRRGAKKTGVFYGEKTVLQSEYPYV